MVGEWGVAPTRPPSQFEMRNSEFEIPRPPTRIRDARSKIQDPRSPAHLHQPVVPSEESDS